MIKRRSLSSREEDQVPAVLRRRHQRPRQHLGAHQPRPRPADGLPPEADGDVRHHRAGGQEEAAGRQGAGK